MALRPLATTATDIMTPPRNCPSPPKPPLYLLERLPRQTRQDIRKAFYILLAVGLVLGAITAGGVVWIMNRLDLIGVPEQQEQQL